MNKENQVLSVNQCRELISLGLNMENASIYWVIEENGEHQLTFNSGSICNKELLPTFTLQDILEMLPKKIEAYKDGSKLPLIITITGSDKYAIVYDNPFCKNGKVGLTISKSLLEAAFNMLKWCKQNNHI